MSICNRDLSLGQQRQDYHTARTLGVAASAAVSYVLMNVPYPSALSGINIAAVSISGAPQIAIEVRRFVVGAGATTLVAALGGTQTILAYGTSGAMSVSLPSVGSTLVQLQTNDMIVATALFGAGNVAIEADIAICINALQDFKSQYGLTSI